MFKKQGAGAGARFTLDTLEKGTGAEAVFGLHGRDDPSKPRCLHRVCKAAAMGGTLLQGGSAEANLANQFQVLCVHCNNFLTHVGLDRPSQYDLLTVQRDLADSRDVQVSTKYRPLPLKGLGKYGKDQEYGSHQAYLMDHAAECGTQQGLKCGGCASSTSPSENQRSFQRNSRRGGRDPKEKGGRAEWREQTVSAWRAFEGESKSATALSRALVECACDGLENMPLEGVRADYTDLAEKIIPGLRELEARVKAAAAAGPERSSESRRNAREEHMANARVAAGPNGSESLAQAFYEEARRMNMISVSLVSLHDLSFGVGDSAGTDISLGEEGDSSGISSISVGASSEGAGSASGTTDARMRGPAPPWRCRRYKIC